MSGEKPEERRQRRERGRNDGERERLRRDELSQAVLPSTPARSAMDCTGINKIFREDVSGREREVRWKSEERGKRGRTNLDSL